MQNYDATTKTRNPQGQHLGLRILLNTATLAVCVAAGVLLVRHHRPPAAPAADGNRHPPRRPGHQVPHRGPFRTPAGPHRPTPRSTGKKRPAGGPGE